MAWLSPALTKQEVRQRFIELDQNNCPPEIIEPAITSAETAVRALAGRFWKDDSNLAADPLMRDLVIHWALAELYDSQWGMSTFIDTANNVAKAKRKYVTDLLDKLRGSNLTTATRKGSRVASNATLTDPVFDMGRPGDWSEPTGALETTLDEDRNRYP